MPGTATMARTSALCAGVLLLLAAADAPAKGPKYYFKIHEVDTKIHKDSSIETLARDLLEKELGSRPEFTADLGGAADDAAVVAELKKRGLRGFRVSLKLEKLDQALKEPKPGGRLKQLELDQKLSVFGTTFPGEKMAFSGEGESTILAEVVESRLAQEAQPLIKDGMAQALKQAVDQAVMKLSMPKSAPMNESKRRKKK
jgi:hypothetical protein